MKFFLHSSICFMLALLLFGCASNQKHYEQPLYDMKVLGSTDTGAWQVEEFSEQQLSTITPGERPPIDSDEAGLWMTMDNVEKDYKTSGKTINDEKLNSYLKEILGRLTPEYANDIRIYVMEVPYFNAFMAPNGAMVVWTGLLLRAGNEAQLASVLGHEVAHYLRRHSLQQMRNAINTTNSLTFFRLATAIAGVGFVGDVASLACIGGFQAYSRDMEREADGYGIAMLVRAGYNPKESARLWQHVIKEKEASKDNTFSVLLFDSHPPSEERLTALNGIADKLIDQGKEFETAQQRYLDHVAPFRFAFLKDELHQRDFSRFEILINSLVEQNYGLGEVYFFKGEMYRLRGEDGDVEKAIEAYEKAVKEAVCPAEAFRSLGLIYKARGNIDDAKKYFTIYLERKPDPVDREMIMNML
jgi:Zn-dependent protease with chaperone function